VVLAKEAATLDVLSDGRLELGLGAGFSRREYEHAGIRFDAPQVRADRLGEAVQILKGLFTGKSFSFAGTHYAVTDLTGFPTPVQRPYPPFLIGGTSDRLLSLAAREADIIGVQTVSTATGAVSQDPKLRLAETIARKIELVRQVAGARFSEIELSTVASITVSDDRRAAAEQFARQRGWSGISAEQVLDMPSVFIGSVDGIVAQMQQRRERYGFSYYIVFDHAISQAAPVVQRLAGR
jgi:probable F420-dependent oxidoreductase